MPPDEISYIPHNDLDQFHCSFIQGVKKLQENTTLFTHLPNNEAKSHTEHNQSQYVDSFRICPDDLVVLGYILPREGTRGPIHSDHQDQARKLLSQPH